MCRHYKRYCKDDSSFRKLFENNRMLLGHVYETAYLFNKITKEEFSVYQFENSDPTCGIIGSDNDWCLIGGDILVLRTMVDGTLRRIGDLKDIYDLKSIDAYTVQVLIDPWSKEAAMWQLEINGQELTKPVRLIKIKDFTDYHNQPYTEEIVW